MTKNSCTQCTMDREIGEIHNDVKWLRAKLEGNGHKGLITMVSENTDFRVGEQSRSKMMLSIFGSGWLVSILMFCLLIFDVL